jgi:putative sugar O-methyltransferase
VSERFRGAGLDLEACPASDVGAPEDLVTIGGRPWTLMHLNYCDMFVRAYPHLSLPEDPSYVEIGPGLGRGMEVVAKLFPRATVIGFDIAPQLYVAHQYLKSIFSERFLTYDDAMRLEPADAGEARRMLAGRVTVLPAARLKTWTRLPVDVFWNSASFQEMEPDNVRNYLALVNGMSPRSIYINALPGGNFRARVERGQVSTAEPVTEDIYFASLAPDYEASAIYPTDYFLAEGWAYRSYVFRRRGPAQA